MYLLQLIGHLSLDITELGLSVISFVLTMVRALTRGFVAAYCCGWSLAEEVVATSGERLIVSTYRS